MVDLTKTFGHVGIGECILHIGKTGILGRQGVDCYSSVHPNVVLKS